MAKVVRQSTCQLTNHYLQTTDAHWERAVIEPTVTTEVGGKAGGNISANQGKSTTGQDRKKPNKERPQRLAEACVSSDEHPRGLVGLVDIARKLLKPTDLRGSRWGTFTLLSLGSELDFNGTRND